MSASGLSAAIALWAQHRSSRNAGRSSGTALNGAKGWRDKRAAWRHAQAQLASRDARHRDNLADDEAGGRQQGERGRDALSQQQQQEEQQEQEQQQFVAPGALPQALFRSRGGPVLQLAAAWHALAARLPAGAGVGPSAELILNALKLALAHAPVAAAHGDGRPAAERALGVASLLAELSAVGLPLDAEAIAAGVLAEVLEAGGRGRAAGSGGGAPQPPFGSAVSVDGSLLGSVDGVDGGAPGGGLTLELIEARVGPLVAQLTHDVQRVHALPSRVDLCDDQAASALRELCLTFYDVRAVAVGVAARLAALRALRAPPRGGPPPPRHQQQVTALEALQIYAPLGHALGMRQVSGELEDTAFHLLFPASYAATAAWLERQAADGGAALAAAAHELRAAAAAHPRFCELAAGLTVTGRTKSLYSTLKKLLRLGDTARGGRARSEVYDLLGLRCVVEPRADLPAGEAEAAAAQARGGKGGGGDAKRGGERRGRRGSGLHGASREARACYLVRDVALSLWQPVPGRSKDYVARPKPNGYQSLHLTVRLPPGGGSEDGGGERVVVDVEAPAALVLSPATAAAGVAAAQAAVEAAAPAAADAAHNGGGGGGPPTLELQIRTRAMHEQAEGGEAAHAAYKGGLDATQARQLKAWTDALLGRGGGDSAQVGAAAGPEAAAAGAPAGAAVAAAAGGLFGHLDRNGDGRISLGELAEVLGELGVTGDEPRAAAAREVLAAAQGAAAAPAGPGAGAGGSLGSLDEEASISFEQFLQLQQQAGLLHALSAVDAKTVGWLEQQEQEQPAGALGGGAAASGARAPGAAVRRASPAPGASGGARAWGRGVGRRGAGARGARLAARAFLESGSRGTSTSASSVDDVPDLGGPARSGGGGANGASSSGRPGAGARASVGLLLEEPSSRPGTPASTAAPRRVEGEALPAADADAPSLLAKPPRPAGGTERAAGARRPPLLRLLARGPPPPADAVWQVIPLPPPAGAAPGARLPALLTPMGEPAGGVAAGGAARGGAEAPAAAAVALPERGPCVVGMARHKDCDLVLDLPTVSNRHACFEVERNRGRLQPGKEARLLPGDVVCLAEPHLLLMVDVVAPEEQQQSAQHQQHGRRHAGSDVPRLPQAVAAALRLAAALEAAAAAAGCFPPPAADGACGAPPAPGELSVGVAQRARALMAEGKHAGARSLLLAAAMSLCPAPHSEPAPSSSSSSYIGSLLAAAGLWAQLASLERQRARLRQPGGSYAIARAFFRAASACFEAPGGSSSGGDGAGARAERRRQQQGSGAAAGAAEAAEQSEGLARALSSWGLMELQLGHPSAGRRLLQAALDAARAHPRGAAAGGAPRLLLSWAQWEWRRGSDVAAAQRLCGQALAAEPGNPYALTMLGRIAEETGQAAAARALYRAALDAAPAHVSAAQAWARLEAAAGDLPAARQLFERALALEPGSAYVLQAWGVAEARAGRVAAARSLLRRCTVADPDCAAAWHAWARLEERQGNTDAARRLYAKALLLKGGRVETLSALGRLERCAGELEAAEAHLGAALAADPAHQAALQELALLRRAQGAEGEAAQLERQVRRLNAGRAAQLARVRKEGLPMPAAAPGATAAPPRSQQPPLPPRQQQQQQQQRRPVAVRQRQDGA
eukprot:scaffold9.g3103.t1